MIRPRAAIVLTIAVIGAYYSWCLRATGYSFDWGIEHNGYYNYLGRAFAKGQLHLPLQPAPELLAAPNPWDLAVDDRHKMFDMAFFNGRYYLYHGPVPAVLLFTPWKIISGRDLPERFALFLFCFGGFLFSCGTLLRILRLASVTPGSAALAASVAALGLCQSIPFLFGRVWLYEVAIGGGYFCLSAAFYFLVRGWLPASGLMFGLAVGCRPHLGLAGLIALVGLARQYRKAAAPFALSFGLICAAIAMYNYQRFGDPFEFGIRYLFTAPGQNRTKLAIQYIPAGVFYLLLNPPDFSPVFPFVHTVIRHHQFPPGVFIEGTVGALHLAPFVWLAAWFAGVRTIAASAAAIFLFLASTGWVTQRYEADFLPLGVLAAVASLCIVFKRRLLWGVIFSVLFAYGAFVSLAIGITGPYDEMLKRQPAEYVRLARWFSPIPEHRPLLNPRVSVEIATDVGAVMLLKIGQFYSLYLEGDRLISASADSQQARTLAKPPSRIGVSYAPETRKLTVTVDGELAVVQSLESLVTAPSQVTAGERVTIFRKTIDP